MLYLKDNIIKDIKYCINCGDRDSVYILPFPGMTSIECDKCGHGFVLYEELEKDIDRERFKDMEDIYQLS